MLVAVGMYLPFHSTAAIFVGGIIKQVLEFFMNRRKFTPEEKTKASNIGVLMSSGLIAGEALMAVILAFIVLWADIADSTFKLANYGLENPSVILGLFVFIGLIYLLVVFPLRKSKA